MKDIIENNQKEESEGPKGNGMTRKEAIKNTGFCSISRYHYDFAK